MSTVHDNTASTCDIAFLCLAQSGTHELSWGPIDEKLVAYLNDHTAPDPPVSCPGPRPSLAFGLNLVLDEERCRHWARYIARARAGSEEVFKLPAEELAHELESAMWAVPDMLPTVIYVRIPELPRIRYSMSCVAKKCMDYGPYRWDLIQRVKVKLGVGEQRRNWYRVHESHIVTPSIQLVGSCGIAVPDVSIADTQ
ncbi:hypothetical protein C8Q80DRAFT_1118441 [Daedaleopsis nitida]|nr:hypothetical protein C8Q80DRAFT_1118441 [Daedaleopsis nitida]